MSSCWNDPQCINPSSARNGVAELAALDQENKSKYHNNEKLLSVVKEYGHVVSIMIAVIRIENSLYCVCFSLNYMQHALL